jgi:uridine phosphorylase
MDLQHLPILGFDPDREPIIDPQTLLQPREDMPPHCVLCFFQNVIDHLLEEGRLQEITSLGSEMGRHPVYRYTYGGRPVALAQPGIGAPFAAAVMEEMIALGGRAFIACGGAGVLDAEIAVGHLVVPTAAIRAEGTSDHYVPPSREVLPAPAAVQAIRDTLRQQNLPYVLGKTWTTDAVYRETRAQVARYRAEGCLTVEMEAAALFAVGAHRDVPVGQILYGGDSLAGEAWDSRRWQDRWSVRKGLVELAAEACLAL